MIRKLFLTVTLIGGLLLGFDSVKAAIILAPTPEPLFSGVDWTKQLDERERQKTGINVEMENLGVLAVPMINEQKGITEKLEPLVAERKVINDNRDEALSVYKGRGCGRTFKIPDEQAAFNSCETLKASTDIKLKKWDDELDRGRPKVDALIKRWEELEKQLAPYEKAYNELTKRLKAIDKEIARLKDCRALRAKARTKLPFTDLELEKLHHCESVVFDGTDPNLPPLTWRAPTFRAERNNRE